MACWNLQTAAADLHLENIKFHNGTSILQPYLLTAIQEIFTGESFEKFELFASHYGSHLIFVWFGISVLIWIQGFPAKHHTSKSGFSLIHSLQ